ncbi:MAG: hypothetical protein RSE36_07205, partial [Oscillospiraceae bacterium]
RGDKHKLSGFSFAPEAQNPPLTALAHIREAAAAQKKAPITDYGNRRFLFILQTHSLTDHQQK